MAEITSRPYRLDAAQACERCVFGTGEHAEWCEALNIFQVIERYMPAQVAAIAKRTEADLLDNYAAFIAGP